MSYEIFLDRLHFLLSRVLPKSFDEIFVSYKVVLSYSYSLLCQYWLEIIGKACIKRKLLQERKEAKIQT